MAAVVVQAPVSALQDSFKALELSYGDKQFAKQQLSGEEKQASGAARQYVKPADDPLPAGFPANVSPSSLWDGQVLINEPEKWLYQFTEVDIRHLNAAYDHFASLGLPNNDISRDTFPISEESELYKALEKAADKINHGLGLRVLRGLPVDSWTRAKQLVVFAGVSAYIGGRRIKQGKQNVVHLRDITNLDVDKRPAITVKGQTSGNQVFHNDGSAGIVGLITLGVAESGGLSQLSSVARTYNHLAETRRDIVRELAKDDWVNKVYPTGKPLIFAVDDKNVISSYSRRPYFGFYEADPDVPALPKQKHLALDAVHFTAEQFSLDLDLQKGDLEYFNNLTVFHARTSSEDSEKNARHLIRVWLENKGQELPSDLREHYDRLNDGIAHAWPLEAWDSTDPYVTLTDANTEAK